MTALKRLKCMCSVFFFQELENIEGMLFSSSTNTSRDDVNNSGTLKDFPVMENLKILIVKEESYASANNILGVMDNYFPSSLRCVDFPRYGFPSLPKTFHTSGMDNNPSELELVGFCLHRSSLQDCTITKVYILYDSLLCVKFLQQIKLKS